MNSNDDDQDDELGVVDAAEYLGKSPRTLADMRYFREGPAFRKGPDRRVHYRRADLDEWLAQRPVAAPPRRG